MNETKYKDITNNNLVRFLISKNYYYINRYKDKDTGRYSCRFVVSPLFEELLEIYNSMSKEDRNTFTAKDKQKAE